MIQRKRKKINIKKLILLIFFCAIMFGVVPALSKYKSATPEQIITILTKYHVNYKTAGGSITEPEKFNSYVSQTGLVLPVEGEVTRSSYDFLGWYNDNNFTGDAITKIESGETGDKLFFAAWQLAQYNLNVKVKDTEGNITNGLPENYSIVIDKDEQGNDKVIDLNSNGAITVGKYQTVSIRTTYAENMTLGGFGFIDDNGKEVDIEITTRYQEGDQYIYYDFKMPRQNITLMFIKENTYVDISKSPITFEENVSIEGGLTTQSGFWYNSTINGMTPIKTDETKGKFYAWDYTEPFYVTSNGNETQNQLILVNAITVYFKDCKLVARDGINMEGRKINGKNIEGVEPSVISGYVGNDLANYGNIVINKDVVTSYTVNLYIEGENTITTIMPNIYNTTPAYEGKINIYGKDNGKMNLGLLLDTENVSFYGLNLEEITDFNSEYVIYINTNNSSHGNIAFYYCNINVPNKRIYTYYGNIGYYSKGNLSSIISTIADIGSSYHYAQTFLTGKSFLHVRNDILGSYNTIYLEGDASIIVEGNILTTYSHWSAQPYINTNGYVIVKGNRFDAENISFIKGTIITNLLELGRYCSLSGGTLITNLISNPVCLYTGNIDNEGNYQYNGTGSTELANSNDDNYLFLTRSTSNATAGIYSFKGTNVYILGKYNILDTGTYRYDTSKKATDYSELNDAIEQLATDGKITNYPEISESTNETIIIGNSKDSAAYNVRTVEISGGNIYASGNITFFNDVKVTGGVINCTGIFSSKRNLEITGGTINAEEIGNSYNLTNSSNGLNSWKTTTISGGTLNTKRLGATAKVINTTTSKGTLVINGEAQISSDIDIVTDTYINYVYDFNIFSNGNTLNNIRFSGKKETGTLSNISNLQIAEPALEEEKYEFIKPTINNEEQKWKYQSLNGIDINYVDKYGYVNGEENSAIYNNIQLNLYAAKEKYNLTVNGKNYSATNNGEQVEFLNTSAEIKSDNKVVLSVEKNLIDKVVVWYKDNSGIMYNAIENEADIDKENATITFKMPNADTEVWIVDGTEIENLTLDLSAYNVSILADGFATEPSENRKNNNIFKYNGDIVIAQSNIEGTTYENIETYPVKPTNGNYTDKVTYNKIFIEGTNINNIILKNIIQNTIDVDEYAVIIGENVECRLYVDGAVQVKTIQIPETSNLNIIGKNEHDSIYIKSTGTNTNSRMISNNNQTTGSVELENLRIHQCLAGAILYNNNSKKSEYLNIKNCICINKQFFERSMIARNVKNVNITNSTIEFIGRADWHYYAFYNVENLKIESGSIVNTYGSLKNPFSFIYGVTNMELNDAIVTENLRNSNSNIYYQLINVSNLPVTVTLNGNSQFNSNYRYMFRDKLILNDESSVNIGDTNTPGYLFAPNIEINDKAQINSANVVMSGYYNPTEEVATKNELLNRLSQNVSIKDGENETGLKINGGEVNAKEFIGGDVNTIIEINGGTINSNKIGTVGNLFGYAKYIPKVGEEYVYTYSKIPEKGTKVTVNSGTVNVSENGYIGGMNAQVEINGGTVNLEENSTIGMTETDATKLINNITSQGNIPSELVDINITGGSIIGEKGLINTPYSTIDISNTSIKQKDILAENGTVNIKGATNDYDNPLGEGERVGILASENLIAQNITISDGASVYAKNAITKTNTNSAIGSLKVGANSYLYTLHYGTEGNGKSIITNEGTIIGNRQYAIQYNMNDTYTDKAKNSNPTTYTYGEQITLKEPIRFGYEFKGWYDSDNNPITEITSTDSGDKVINAKWEEKTVEFIIKTKASDVGISNDEFENQVDTSLGSLNTKGDIFTYSKKVIIKYHALLNTELLLSNYNLKTYSASAAKIENNELNPEGDILNLTSSGMTVTKEIMEYYLKNNEPIEISICEFISNEVKTASEE